MFKKNKTISAMKVRQNLGRIMNEVSLRDEDYVVERAGKPLVAIVPFEQYRFFQAYRENSDVFFQSVDSFREGVKGVSDDVLDSVIDEASSYAKK